MPSATTPLALDSRYVVIYGTDQAPAAVTGRFASGHAIWWAGSAPLANGGIGRPRHVELLVNALGPPGARTILWDEFYHGHTRSFWSYLAGTPVPFAILQLAAIAGVALFTYVRRRARCSTASSSRARRRSSSSTRWPGCTRARAPPATRSRPRGPACAGCSSTRPVWPRRWTTRGSRPPRPAACGWIRWSWTPPCARRIGRAWTEQDRGRGAAAGAAAAGVRVGAGSQGRLRGCRNRSRSSRSMRGPSSARRSSGTATPSTRCS